MTLKGFLRAVTPAPVRRWLQYRRLERLVASFPRCVVEHRYGSATLKVELADGLAAGWYDHDWAPFPEFPLLSRHGLRPGARVFDIGAHQGIVGLVLGGVVGQTGQVVLVEPNAHNVAMCRRNVDLNCMPWVVPRQAAISSR